VPPLCPKGEGGLREDAAVNTADSSGEGRCSVVRAWRGRRQKQPLRIKVLGDSSSCQT
jgi:hypothetical protein